MTIVIPAYEPDHNLLFLVQYINVNSSYDILIVNDGSSSKFDSIFENAKSMGCTIINHSKNLGKGAALKTAFSYIQKDNTEKEGVVCADCDGQHTWKDISNVAENIGYHKNAIVMGCREFTGSIPLRSLIGNKLTCLIFSFISGSSVSDTQTGLRGFSIEMLPWLLSIKGDRYEYEMNQLLEARPSGYDLFSIPIKTVYENKNKSSHFRPVRDSIKIYLPILKFGMSSASCGIIDFILLFIVNWLTGNLLLSVVGARAISSFCNYILNKNLVFKPSSRKSVKALLQYYELVVIILLCNCLLISLLSGLLGLSLLAAKLITEGLLFLISYYTQKKYVFGHFKVGP